MKLLSSILFAALFAARPANAECYKWNAGLSVCETNPATCVSGADPPTHGQWLYYFSKNLTETPQDACHNKYAYTVYKNTLIVPFSLGAVTWGCKVDVNFNNTIDRSENYAHSLVTLDNIPREEMCERTPEGPYTRYGTTGTEGGHFSQTQKDTVRSHNMMVHNTSNNEMRSDVGPSAPPQLIANEHDTLFMNYSVFGWDDDLAIPYIFGPALANVDHIIPRKDVHGCECGPNSYSNMLIISWELNNKMSNNSQDVDRQAILEKWSNPP